jgi:chromosome segregation ATPase
VGGDDDAADHAREGTYFHHHHVHAYGRARADIPAVGAGTSTDFADEHSPLPSSATSNQPSRYSAAPWELASGLATPPAAPRPTSHRFHSPDTGFSVSATLPASPLPPLPPYPYITHTQDGTHSRLQDGIAEHGEQYLSALHQRLQAAEHEAARYRADIAALVDNPQLDDVAKHNLQLRQRCLRLEAECAEAGMESERQARLAQAQAEADLEQAQLEAARTLRLTETRLREEHEAELAAVRADVEKEVLAAVTRERAVAKQEQEEQRRAFAEREAALDAQIADLQQAMGAAEARHRSSVAPLSAELLAMRERFAAELEYLASVRRDEIGALRAQQEDEITLLTDAHERKLAHVREVMAQEAETLTSEAVQLRAALGAAREATWDIAQTDNDAMKAARAACAAELDDLRSQLVQEARDHQEYRLRLESLHRAALDEAAGQYSGKVSALVAAYKKEQLDLQSQHAAERLRTQEEAHAERLRLQTALHAATARVEELERGRAALIKELDDLRVRSAGVSERLQGAQGSSEALNAELAQTRAALAAVQALVAETEAARAQGAVEDNAALQALLSGQKDVLSVLEAQRADLTASHERIASSVAAARDDIAAIRPGVAVDTQAAVATVRDDASAARSHMETLLAEVLGLLQAAQARIEPQHAELTAAVDALRGAVSDSVDAAVVQAARDTTPALASLAEGQIRLQQTLERVVASQASTDDFTAATAPQLALLQAQLGRHCEKLSAGQAQLQELLVESQRASAAHTRDQVETARLKEQEHTVRRFVGEIEENMASLLTLYSALVDAQPVRSRKGKSQPQPRSSPSPASPGPASASASAQHLQSSLCAPVPASLAASPQRFVVNMIRVPETAITGEGNSLLASPSGSSATSKAEQHPTPHSTGKSPSAVSASPTGAATPQRAPHQTLSSPSPASSLVFPALSQHNTTPARPSTSPATFPPESPVSPLLPKLSGLLSAQRALAASLTQLHSSSYARAREPGAAEEDRPDACVASERALRQALVLEQQQSQRLQEQNAALKEQAGLVEARLDAVQSIVDDYQRKVDALADARLEADRLRDALGASQGDNATLQARLDLLQAELRDTASSRDALVSERDELRNQSLSLQGRAAQLDASLSTAEGSHAAVQARLREAEAQVHQLTTENAVLRQQHEQAAAEAARVASEREETRREQAEAARRHEKLLQRCSDAERKLALSESTASQHAKELAQTRDELASLQHTHDVAAQQFASLRAEHRRATKHIAATSAAAARVDADKERVLAQAQRVSRRYEALLRKQGGALRGVLQLLEHTHRAAAEAMAEMESERGDGEAKVEAGDESSPNAVVDDEITDSHTPASSAEGRSPHPEQASSSPNVQSPAHPADASADLSPSPSLSQSLPLSLGFVDLNTAPPTPTVTLDARRRSSHASASPSTDVSTTSSADADADASASVPATLPVDAAIAAFFSEAKASIAQHSETTQTATLALQHHLAAYISHFHDLAADRRALMQKYDVSSRRASEVAPLRSHVASLEAELDVKSRALDVLRRTLSAGDQAVEQLEEDKHAAVAALTEAKQRLAAVTESRDCLQEQQAFQAKQLRACQAMLAGLARVPSGCSCDCRCCEFDDVALLDESEVARRRKLVTTATRACGLPHAHAHAHANINANVNAKATLMDDSDEDRVPEPEPRPPTLVQQLRARVASLQEALSAAEASLDRRVAAQVDAAHRELLAVNARELEAAQRAWAAETDRAVELAVQGHEQRVRVLEKRLELGHREQGNEKELLAMDMGYLESQLREAEQRYSEALATLRTERHAHFEELQQRQRAATKTSSMLIEYHRRDLDRLRARYQEEVASLQSDSDRCVTELDANVRAALEAVLADIDARVHTAAHLTDGIGAEGSGEDEDAEAEAEASGDSAVSVQDIVRQLREHLAQRAAADEADKTKQDDNLTDSSSVPSADEPAGASTSTSETTIASEHAPSSSLSSLSPAQQLHLLYSVAVPVLVAATQRWRAQLALGFTDDQPQPPATVDDEDTDAESAVDAPAPALTPRVDPGRLRRLQEHLALMRSLGTDADVVRESCAGLLGDRLELDEDLCVVVKEWTEDEEDEAEAEADESCVDWDWAEGSREGPSAKQVRVLTETLTHLFRDHLSSTSSTEPGETAVTTDSLVPPSLEPLLLQSQHLLHPLVSHSHPLEASAPAPAPAPPLLLSATAVPRLSRYLAPLIDTAVRAVADDTRARAVAAIDARKAEWERACDAEAETRLREREELLRRQVRAEVKGEVRAEVAAEVRGLVEVEVRDELRDEVRDEVKAEVEAEAKLRAAESRRVDAARVADSNTSASSATAAATAGTPAPPQPRLQAPARSLTPQLSQQSFNSRSSASFDASAGSPPAQQPHAHPHPQLRSATTQSLSRPGAIPPASRPGAVARGPHGWSRSGPVGPSGPPRGQHAGQMQGRAPSSTWGPPGRDAAGWSNTMPQAMPSGRPRGSESAREGNMLTAQASGLEASQLSSAPSTETLSSLLAWRQEQLRKANSGDSKATLIIEEKPSKPAPSPYVYSGAHSHCFLSTPHANTARERALKSSRNLQFGGTPAHK